ncbi:hypothetical protein MMC21_007980 [Puttea exsequens]|nr:hypothetical protein [Puttea exsequens]
MIWGAENHIHRNESENGISWTQYRAYNSSSLTDAAPALAGYGGGLHAFIRGTDSCIYTAKYTFDGGWAAFRKISDAGVYSCPSASEYDIKPTPSVSRPELFCAWQDGNVSGGTICYIIYKNAQTGWSAKMKVPGHERYFSGPRLGYWNTDQMRFMGGRWSVRESLGERRARAWRVRYDTDVVCW